jgi:hypothetical protein
VKSIDKAREEVQREFEQALQLADCAGIHPLAEVERKLWTALLGLGRALVLLFLARQAARPRAQEYEHAGHRWRVSGERKSEVGTRFGKVEFRRAVGRDAERPRLACDLPVDRELELCGGFSLGVVLAITRLCAQLAFGNARATFRETHEWCPSPRAVLRMVDAVGDAAKEFLEQAPAPEDDGEVLVVQVDGRGAPMITPQEHERRRRPHAPKDGSPHRRRRRQRRRQWPRKRRTSGKKSKNAKVAVVGVLYTLGSTPDGMEGPINKRIIATFESHRALFVWLHREACKRGYGTKRTLFLADGAETIWELQQEYFPLAEACIDWCHVVEKLWAVGTCFHEEGSEALKTWVATQTARLRRGSVQPIIDELAAALARTPKMGPGNKWKRKKLSDTVRYLTEHQGRMPYAELRKDDLDIGTGAAEGAVRNLIAMRLDGPGMRWSRQRSERLLHLRCVLINNQWGDLAQYIEQQGHLRLPPQPIPTQPHLAKAA